MSLSHDPFIRKVLSNKQEALDLFIATLPENISEHLLLDKLELIQETFLGNNGEESRTDLLYKIPLKNGSSAYIYLLFEHKSYYDKKIHVQLLDYLSKIYNWQMENEKELNVIIPFVFYHGEKGWDLGLEFLECFTKNSIPENLLQFIPNFSIHLLELTSKGKAFQTKNLALQLYMRLIQTIRNDPEEFVKNLQELFRTLLQEKEDAKRIEILKNLYEYIFRARKDAEDFSKHAIIKEIEGDYMNMLERIREKGREEGLLKGEQIGEQRGKLEGKLEKALETARNMKNLGLSVEVIIKSVGLSETELRENGIL
jgi:predicted transposase/invertase (TIGR01784 family)